MGKILQERQSVNINQNTQSTSFSTQLDFLVPEGKIATLAQGCMVGQVADNFGEAISQKNFNCMICADTVRLAREEKLYREIPDFYKFNDIREVLEGNRNRIYNEIQNLVLQIRKTKPVSETG